MKSQATLNQCTGCVEQSPQHPASRKSRPDAATHKTRSLQSTAQMFLAPLALIAAALSASMATAQVPPPAVQLTADPLYAAIAGEKPAIALALSVEFPTVGAQYVASPGAGQDATYSNANEYLGYYDAESCYRYNNDPSETPVAPLATSDYKRFDRTGGALPLASPDPSNRFKTSRKCADGFSGNFLNWASNSAIDMLRLALTGGDRYIDTPTLTVLQRAVIPNGDPTCMWNSTNFPAKKLDKNGGGTNTYWGAVPAVMINAAAGNDIWIANRSEPDLLPCRELAERQLQRSKRIHAREHRIKRLDCGTPDVRTRLPAVRLSDHSVVQQRHKLRRQRPE